MKFFPLLSSCVILSALSTSSLADGLSLPQGWTQTTFPGTASDLSDELRCANYSDSEWHVTIESQAVKISTRSGERTPKLPPDFRLSVPSKGKEVAAKADDGWLIGFDAGEFGGGLWWASDDGRHKEKLSDENVHAILRRGADLLVLTGLAHMTLDDGKVYAYRHGHQPSESLVELADLGTAPDAALVDQHENVLIAAQRRVVVVDRYNNVRVLYENRDMGMLYPDSISEDSAGNVFVGMRFFVLRLRVAQNGAFVPEWYVPDRCTKTKVIGFSCACVAPDQQR